MAKRNRNVAIESTNVEIENTNTDEQILTTELKSTDLVVSSGKESAPSETAMNYGAVKRLPAGTVVTAVATDPQTGEVWSMVRTSESAKPYFMIKDSVHGSTINEGSDWKRFVGFAKKINSGKIDPKTGKTMSNSSNARIGDLQFYLAPVEGRSKPRVNRTLHYMDPADRAAFEAERAAAREALAKASKAAPSEQSVE